MDEQLRVRFVVSLDADERDLMAYTMDELFKVVHAAFPGRHPSVGLAVLPNEKKSQQDTDLLHRFFHQVGDLWPPWKRKLHG